LAAAEQAFLDQLRNTFVVAALLAMGLGLVLSVWISWTLSAPLAHMRQAASAYAAHQWEKRVPVHGADEVSDVARSLNSMADELQRAEIQRRNLFADIAHELRAPLTVLQGNLSALLDGVYPLEMSEVATVYDQSRLLSRLVDDVSQLALAEAGHLRVDLAQIAAGPIVQSTVEALAGAAQAQRIALVVTVAPQLPAVRADPSRLTQILHNLLTNALRHTPPGGHITVTAEAQGQGVRLAVRDTGEGIGPEDLPHVFDRFYRADKTRARATGGSGLGLAIAKALVEAMGGTITAESQVGAGSTFGVWLPAAPKH
jgi:two-component system OmpR family sensor kinase/two-component system sensor histidine kinase BaeS